MMVPFMVMVSPKPARAPETENVLSLKVGLLVRMLLL